MTELGHTYRYLHASNVAPGPRPVLALATTDSTGTSHPHFFEGELLRPRLAAQLLTALHLVVGARFFTPPNTVARSSRLADPVVTAGGGTLRFEAFSTCGSTYARLDLLPDAYRAELAGHGTTNVDFNAPMRVALARLREADGLGLSIGGDQLTLHSGGQAVTERKVALPTRWLRGFIEVQAWQARMRRVLALPSPEVVRALRALPRGSTHRTPLWLLRGPRGLHTTTQPSEDAVRITEVQRLRVLEPLLPQARSVSVFADPAQQASAWVLDYGDARFTLALSAEVWRGFSGEGQALRTLMRLSASGESGLAALRAQLHWQSRLDTSILAHALGWNAEAVADGLRLLGASGLVGFDVHDASHFHRVLPFDLSLVEDLHPRLADAHALLAAGAVAVHARQPFDASVTTDGAVHRVREVDGELQCTCPWFAKHRDLRGPCKHLLAAEASRPTE